MVKKTVCCCLAEPEDPVKKLQHHQDPQLRMLAEELLNILIKDMAPSTVKKYHGAFLEWRAWADTNQIKPLPAPGEMFTLYLILCLKCCTSTSSFDTKEYGVAWAHKKMCLPSPTDHPLAKQVTEAGHRLLGKTTANRKHPLSIHHIRKLYDKYHDGNLAEIQILTLITTGFFGFPRWDDLQPQIFSLSMTSWQYSLKNERMTNIERACGSM